jgi:5'-deoxynucleotidase YfbR-like HD superfamily hydrolase
MTSFDNSYVWIHGGGKLRICPHPDDFSLWDETTVAHALGQLNRWTGHCSDGFSVAQHSVIVSYLVKPELALEGLFHDAPEFVLGDISTPVKLLMGEQALGKYRELTRAWEEVLKRRFKLVRLSDPRTHAEIKEADRLCQYYEARELVGVSKAACREFADATIGFQNWGADPQDRLERLPTNIKNMLTPLSSENAAAAFLHRFKELKR